jgi:hypothetical protein
MPKVREGKTQVSVVIQTGLYMKLLSYAISKYKKTHGAVSKALEDILNWYFNLGEESCKDK